MRSPNVKGKFYRFRQMSALVVCSIVLRQENHVWVHLKNIISRRGLGVLLLLLFVFSFLNGLWLETLPELAVSMLGNLTSIHSITQQLLLTMELLWVTKTFQILNCHHIEGSLGKTVKVKQEDGVYGLKEATAVHYRGRKLRTKHKLVMHASRRDKWLSEMTHFIFK